MEPARGAGVSDSEPVPGRLSERVVKSGLWLGGVAGTGRLVGVLRLAILAHCLGPREFGIVGASLIAIGMLEALSDLGLFLALVQRRDASRDLYDTAWTLGLIRGVAIGALVCLGAPWIGAAFASPDAVPVARVMALVPLAGGVVNIGIVEFRKQLAFGRYYAIQAGSLLADLVVAVPLALRLRSVWAIVAGWLALSVTRVVLSYLLHSYRPRPRLAREHVRGLLGYGRWITWSTALQWGLGEGVVAVVGRLLGLEALALYQMAWRLTGQPAAEAAVLVSSVTVPAYARLQDSHERVRKAHLRVLGLTTLVAAPLALGLALYAGPLVRLLFGSDWTASAELVPILAASAFLSAVTATAVPVFQGLGRPRDQTVVGLAEGLVLASALLAWVAGAGLRGAAFAVLLRGLAGAGVSLWLVGRRLGTDWRSLASASAWPLVACLPLVPLRLAAFPAPATLPGLLGAGCVSAVAYGAALLGLARVGLWRLDPMIASVVDLVRGRDRLRPLSATREGPGGSAR